MAKPDLLPEEIFQNERAGALPQVGAFIDLVEADPASVMVALNALDRSKLPLAPRLSEGQAPTAAELEIQNGRQPDSRERRAIAVGVIWALLATGADKDFDFPRPIEQEISRDRRTGELQRQHRVTDGNPNRQAEVSLRIRARQLAVAVGYLPTRQSSNSSGR